MNPQFSEQTGKNKSNHLLYLNIINHESIKMKKISLFLSIVLVGCNLSKNHDKPNAKDNFWTFNATN